MGDKVVFRLPFRAEWKVGMSIHGDVCVTEFLGSQLLSYNFSAGNFTQTLSCDLPRHIRYSCSKAVNDAGEMLLQNLSRDSPTLVLSKDGRTTTSVQSEGKLLTVLPPRGDIVYAQEKKKDDPYDCVLVIVGREGNTILEPPPQQTWSQWISVCGINENLAVVDGKYKNNTLDIFQNHTRK